ncbi:SHOCT domain-containing protein [Rathayibacter sp. PhB152]|uniref:SHOCT domain-containing protein n=1 Tax=Rathayibacter sp. PhB152 TaxID=2485190 RepID=UPI0011CE7E86|nr:SHOCT domain-containing protein [Rathayibacter sp. PhB152]
MGFFSSALSNGRLSFPGVSEEVVFRAVLTAAAQCRMAVQNADPASGFVLLRAKSSYRHWDGNISVSVTGERSGAVATISGATTSNSLLGVTGKTSQGELGFARGRLDSAIRRAVSLAGTGSPSTPATKEPSASAAGADAQPASSHQKLWSSPFGDKRDKAVVTVFDDAVEWTHRGVEAAITLDAVETADVVDSPQGGALRITAYGREYVFALDLHRARIGASTVTSLVEEHRALAAQTASEVLRSEESAQPSLTASDAVTPAGGSGPDVAQRIAALHGLLTSGAITQEEYDRKKSQLLELL